MPFLVVPRAGYLLEPLYDGMKVLDNKLFITTNISSSMVRARIAQKLAITHLVTPEVEKYIKNNNLYT